MIELNIQTIAGEAAEDAGVTTLNELELAVVGGGIGDFIPY